MITRKRVFSLIYILLIFAMLLSGCTQAGNPDVDSTKDSATESISESTGMTDTTNTTGQPAELTAKEKFQKFLMEEYWYYRALGCTFEKPEDIAAEFYFYNGLAVADRQNPDTFTDEEKTYLASKWSGKYGEDSWSGAKKLPVEKMNAALSILGVTVDDIKIPEHWVYYDKTDSYYTFHRDAFGVVGVTVTQIVTETDGTVQVYWETNQPHTNTATGEILNDGVKMVMTLQEKTDGNYLVLSNIPAK